MLLLLLFVRTSKIRSKGSPKRDTFDTHDRFSGTATQSRAKSRYTPSLSGAGKREGLPRPCFVRRPPDNYPPFWPGEISELTTAVVCRKTGDPDENHFVSFRSCSSGTRGEKKEGLFQTRSNNKYTKDFSFRKLRKIRSG